MLINQNAWFSLILLEKGKSASYTLKSEGNGMYLFVIEGKINFNNETFEARDGIGIWETSSIELSSVENAEILLMEIPMLT